jgi:hypothetical protein
VGCWKCVSPWVYPGLKGGPWHPIPSDWPSPNLVVDTVCHVFNTMGRTTRIYAPDFKRMRKPRIGRDDLHGSSQGVIVEDAKAMCVYLIHNHCMWLPSPGEVPLRYSLKMLTEFFERSKTAVHRSNERAMQLLTGDHHFIALFREVERLLAQEGFKAERTPRHAERTT